MHDSASSGQVRARATSTQGQRLTPSRTAVAWNALGLALSGINRRLFGPSILGPSKNSVDFGDLRRLTPVSRNYGYDRGEPVDRYYIEKFLAAHRDLISGTVLEISENTYTRKFGDDRVTRSEVLHYNDPSPPATYVGDLTDAAHLPSDYFDCIIITQTLMLIYDVSAAVETLHRILKPGGTVLATQAGLTQIAGPWAYTWYWGFTRASLSRLFGDVFTGGKVEVEAYGNVLSTLAFLHGFAQDELTKGELDRNDPEYQMLLSVVARSVPAQNP